MKTNVIVALAFAFGLMACATVPHLDGSPEDTADRMAGNAVAYNQAYGRSIADQLLLNVLRARDRMPLYYLSVSGIAEQSQIVGTSSAQIGSIGLGHNGTTPWGAGQLSQSWATTTKPAYTLDPFSSSAERRARQFEPVIAPVFQSYWENNWSVEVLLSVMVERLDVTKTLTRQQIRQGYSREWTISNGSGAYRGDCGDRAEGRGSPMAREVAYREIDNATRDAAERDRRKHAWEVTTAFEQRCDFVWTMRAIADARARPLLERVNCTPPAGAAQTLPRECAVRFSFEGATYRVQLRALDDMVYFVGSLLRDIDDGVQSEIPHPPLTARVNIRSTDVFPADGEAWTALPRTAPLFRVAELERGVRGVFAAEVHYRGRHYAAGQPNGAVCVGASRCSGRDGPQNDATARVLSLLTQLVIVSQSAEAQLAPRTIVDVRPGN